MTSTSTSPLVQSKASGIPSIKHQLSKILVLVSILCLSTVQLFANWWTDRHNASVASGSHFNASFNSSNGTVHVETFVYNGAYFLVALGPLTYAMWMQSATMSYSTDGVNYTNFYSFGFDHGTQTSSNQLNGFNTSTYTSSNDGNRILNMDLQLINSIKNIKNIKITARLVKDGPGGPDDIVDTKTINITQMSTTTMQQHSFVTALNGNIYEAKARLSYSKPILNEVDNQSNMALYDASNHVKLTGNLLIGTSGSADVAVSNSPKDYYFRQSAYGDRITNNSSSAAVPAFTFPKTASASYNSVTQQVSFTGPPMR